MEQFDFLRQYIEKLFDDNGFAGLNETTRAQFVPQFVAEAERRVGLAVLPLLTPKSADLLAGLLKNENVTAEQLQEFWKTNVPTFETVVQQTLQQFSDEFKKTLAGA